MKILQRHGAIDAILEPWAGRLGAEYAAYRNHAYRVFHYARALILDGERHADIIAIASAFHDLGIWSHDTPGENRTFLSCGDIA